MTTGRINQVTLVKRITKSFGRNDRPTLLSFFLHHCSEENSGSGSVICLIDLDNKIQTIASQYTTSAEK